MSSGSYKQVHVECPFYAFDEPGKKVIACEAITRAEYPAKRQFRRKADWEQCMQDYCCQEYRYCEHYLMLMRYKYEALEEQ